MSNISRRAFGRKMAQGLGATTMVSAIAKTEARPDKASRPNFVFICSDQHTHKYTGFAGHPIVQTPNLDRIAAQGVVFSSNYTGNPICVPGRSSMMTGMYASDCGSYCNSTVWDGSHPTWGTRLKEAGYYCWATGKMDLNDAHDMGFIEKNVSNGHASRPDITSLFRRPCVYRVGERDNVNGEARDSRSGDDEDTQNAVNFMRQQAVRLKQPWACYVGFSQPHPKFRALRKYFDMYYPNRVDMPNVPPGYLEDLHLVYQSLRHFKRIATPIPEDRVRRARAAYYGMVTELDEYIGRIWDVLEETGQLKNTVFIYTSDHGESLGEHGLWLKNNLFDVAARVPLVMAGAGIPGGVKIDSPVGHVDVVASMLEWAGIKRPEELRGYSLIPLMQGKTGDHPGIGFCETHSEGNCTGSFMIRKGDWKYIHFSFYDDMLFNVKDDPYELSDRIHDADVRPIVADLKGILHSLLDPEKVTMDAFEAQEQKLREIAGGRTEDELAEYLSGRLGPGQARLLAKRVKQGALI